MVAFTFNFALLATTFVLSTTSLVDGAAVPARHKAKSLSSKQLGKNAPLLPLPANVVKSHNAEKVNVKAIQELGKGNYHEPMLSQLDTQANDRTNVGRQRYRREGDLKVYHRSSIILSDIKGGSYVVPHARRSNHNHQRVLELKGDHVRKHVRRDSNTTGTATATGVPGTVDIMINTVNSTATQRIASLGLARSSKSNPPFVINAQASDADPTTFYMMTVRPTVVNLATQVFDISTNTLNLWCATYNCSPPEPQSMTLQSCFNDSSSPSGMSQEFDYNPDTMAVTPRSSTDQNNSTGIDSDSDNQATTSTDIANGTSVNSASSPTGSSSVSARDANTPEPQNVTLIFMPSVPTYSEVMSDAAADLEDPSSTTSTVTVTSTVSSTETDTITMTTTSGVDAPSNVASTTPSATSLPFPSDADDSQATSTSSSIPEPSSAGALNIEVVGPDDTSASLTATKNTSSFSSATVSTPTSSSVYAQQIAASIAGTGSSISPSATATSTSPVSTETTDGSINAAAAPMISFST